MSGLALDLGLHLLVLALPSLLRIADRDFDLPQFLELFVGLERFDQALEVIVTAKYGTYQRRKDSEALLDCHHSRFTIWVPLT